jgi:hypothetical protein
MLDHTKNGPRRCDTHTGQIINTRNLNSSTVSEKQAEFRAVEANSETLCAYIDAVEIRAFLTIIHEHVAKLSRGAADPGYLQLVCVDPANGKVRGARYAIGKVEAMAQAAIWHATEGFNVYIETRTIRSDWGPQNGRGGFDATSFVFALVVDNDEDKRKTSAVNIAPSLRIASSPGNSHLWLFFDQLVEKDEAGDLGARLRHSTANTDACTGTITTPFRVPGTPNYPNRNKRARGRAVAPTRLLEYSGRLYSPDEMRTLFPAPPTPQRQPIDDDCSIDECTAYLIENASDFYPNRDVSRDDWFSVMCALHHAHSRAANGDIAAQLKALAGAWTRQSKKYHDRRKPTWEVTWGGLDKSLSKEEAGLKPKRRKITTVGTIFHKAGLNGWEKWRAEARWCRVVGEMFDEIAHAFCKGRQS